MGVVAEGVTGTRERGTRARGSACGALEACVSTVREMFGRGAASVSVSGGDEADVEVTEVEAVGGGVCWVDVLVVALSGLSEEPDRDELGGISASARGRRDSWITRRRCFTHGSANMPAVEVFVVLSVPE